MAEDRLVIGIDLGTTYSCVGIWRNGRVEIAPNDQGNRTTPSMVAFTDGERLIGEGANHQVASNASNTVFDVKRLIGRSFSDASVQSDAKYWPFEITAGPDDKPLIKARYRGEKKEFSPEEISAMVLVKMKETAEAYAERTITDAVITVPAYFNASQRQATKDAALIAGLTVLRIINDPTAAAITYSVNTNRRQSTVLVYDLGGGTLDVSLVVITTDKLQVIATAGNTNLGGDDFTNNMVDHFVNEFKKKNRKDISGDKKALGRLRRSCEDAKRRLSTNPRTSVEVLALFEGIDFHSKITRDQFEHLNEDLFRKCMEPVERCLEYANKDKTQVDDVVLVGGCTRIPLVQKLLKDFFNGKEPCRNINADEAVAHGATVQAAMLRGKQTSHVLPQVNDITPFSQGIGMHMPEGLMWEVIERYTTIPTTKETLTFVSVKDNQPSVDIMVYEDEMAKKVCIPILDPRNKVRFHIDEDGILHVSVSAQGEEGWKTITNLVGRFSTDEIEMMKQDAKKYKVQDEEHKDNVQARNDIEYLLFNFCNNIKKLKDSAARLLLHPEPTREQEKETALQESASKRQLQSDSLALHGNGPPRVLQESASKGQPSHRGFKPQKAQAKENWKMIQAHKDTIYRINKLQATAGETTKWLETKELTTSEIIGKQKQIEEEYDSISSQIGSASHSMSNKSLWPK